MVKDMEELIMTAEQQKADGAEQVQDTFSLEFTSSSKNESFARTVIAAFAARLNPTLEEISDLKTAVSEAVTNCVIHAYEKGEGSIRIDCVLEGRLLTVAVTDRGVGIPDIKQAMEPLYTTRPEWERSGMGFAFMEAFMDELEVESESGKGTTVRMKKRFSDT